MDGDLKLKLKYSGYVESENHLAPLNTEKWIFMIQHPEMCGLLSKPQAVT